jgi:hypothetical protein
MLRDLIFENSRNHCGKEAFLRTDGVSEDARSHLLAPVRAIVGQRRPPQFQKRDFSWIF